MSFSLLARFAQRTKQSILMASIQHQELVKGWETLLTEFSLLPIHDQTESDFVPEINRLLEDFDGKLNGWRDEQKIRADDFNILRTMNLSRKELCHSNILAWLLDPKGTHAQGTVGFRLFLNQIKLPENFANLNYHVIRELSCDESQIDIVIEAEGEFIIGIENKIDAEEGDTQTEREWRDLQRRKKCLSIQREVTALFLTPGGTSPLSNFFKPISWQIVANVFEEFADEAKAGMVKMFAKHYAETIKHEIVVEIEEDKT